MWLLALTLIAAPPALDLRFVDFQAALDELPGTARARAELVEARRKAQADIDGRRTQLLRERAALGPAEFARASAELDQAIEAAEAKLDARQARVLEPLLETLERARKRLEAKGRRVVRLDRASLIGWPQACNSTRELVAAAGGASPELPVAPCRARSLRLVRVAALALESEQAKRQQAELDRLQAAGQRRIDEKLARVQAIEAGASTAEARARASAARTKLDEEVAALRDELRARRVRMEQAVLERIERRLGRAAAELDGIVVVDGPVEAEGLEGLPREDGFAWARAVLGGGTLR